MIAIGKDELYCDLAETYGILNWAGLSVTQLATLSCGLSRDSRIKRKLAGRELTLTEELTAAIFDATNMLVWLNSSDGATGENRPRSLLALLSGENTNDNEVEGFLSVEEFEEARSKYMEN